MLHKQMLTSKKTHLESTCPSWREVDPRSTKSNSSKSSPVSSTFASVKWHPSRYQLMLPIEAIPDSRRGTIDCKAVSTHARSPSKKATNASPGSKQRTIREARGKTRMRLPLVVLNTTWSHSRWLKRRFLHARKNLNRSLQPAAAATSRIRRPTWSSTVTVLSSRSSSIRKRRSQS